MFNRSKVPIDKMSEEIRIMKSKMIGLDDENGYIFTFFNCLLLLAQEVEHFLYSKCAKNFVQEHELNTAGKIATCSCLKFK